MQTVLTIKVCNDIYDTAINIHYPKVFQSAFQFQISLTYTPPEMQVNRNYKLNNTYKVWLEFPEHIGRGVEVNAHSWHPPNLSIISPISESILEK